MSDFAPTLDDAGLFLPSDIFSDVFYPSPPASPIASAFPLHLPTDNLAPLRSHLPPAVDAELASQLAAALTLRRAAKVEAAAAKPRLDQTHSFFEYGPVVQPSSQGPALFSPPTDGEVRGQGCFGNFTVSHQHVDGRPLYRFQPPAKPVRISKAEESGYPARARARVQVRAMSGRVGWTGSRDYGGTGVFLPRIVDNGTGRRKSGMQGGVWEKQNQQPVRGLHLARQAMPYQHPSERALPQDWSY